MKSQQFLSKTKDKELVIQLKELISHERKLATKILHYLREINRRRLYAQMGFSSLFTFCVEELGYSESSAYHKIAALKLMAELPQVEKKIEDGSLTLSNVAQAQTFFRREAKENQKVFTATQKQDVLSELENKTRRQAQQLLSQKSPSFALPHDRQRPINSTATEIRFTADQKLLEKLERIRSLESHSLEDSSYNELLHRMADLVLKQKDPELKRKPTSQPTSHFPAARNPRVTKSPRISRCISSTIRQEVWFRDKGQCSYVDPETGHQCSSRHRLQVDHIRPYALGGGNELSNLRLLCQSHNLHWASMCFGEQKVQRHFGS